MSSFAIEMVEALGVPYSELSGDIGDGFHLQAQSTTYPPVPASDSDSEPDLKAIDSGVQRQHIFRPLGHDEVRLLVLNPGAADDPIECYLEHCSVGKAKPFRALSYVWGDACDPRTIMLDGSAFQVTKSLGGFLAAYRNEYESSVLWIDALCINQADLAERQLQIQHMKRVYEGADSIVIWLGDATALTPRAFDHIAHVYRDWWMPRLDREGSTQRGLASVTADDAAEILGGGRQQGQDDADASQQTVWTGMQDIFERPWWTRIWVYQEATAPTRNGPVGFCGPYSIEFSMVLVINQVTRHLASSGDQLTLYQGCTSKTSVLMQVYWELRRKYQKQGSSHFLKLADLLPALRGFDATNPRDKLYALIPTSLDGAELLDVTYGLPVEDVYINSAWAFIQKHRNLDILGHCSIPDNDSPLSSRLPSWVPDWTAKSTPTHFFKRGISGRFRLDAVGDGIDIGNDVEIGKMYNAAKDSATCAKRDATGRKLVCDGVVFDQVQHVSPSAGKTPEGNDVAQDWAHWLEGVQPPNSTKEALCHVMVADCYRNAVDIGTRGCKASVEAGVETLSAGRMDITGPHPATFRRRLILTEKGYLGLTAKHVESGDRVVILMGGQLPSILRKVDSHYVLIAEAYIHDIMDGQAQDEESKIENFEIW